MTTSAKTKESKTDIYSHPEITKEAAVFHAAQTHFVSGEDEASVRMR